VGKVVHDSLNTLSLRDDIRVISHQLCSFVAKIDFGRDVEKSLNFYVDCRQAFVNLDAVKQYLVLRVCALTMRTLEIVKGNHNKKTASFVRACIAYCFITIPSMEDLFARLNLYLLASQVSFMNQSLPQADAFLKTAITLLQEVPAILETDGQARSTEPVLVSYLNNFIALLVAVPGHPDLSAFYIIKGLLKVVKDFGWEKGSAGKARIYLSMIATLCAMQQPKLAYSFPNVDANDVLYSSDSDYAEELQGLINKLLEDLLEELAKLKEENPSAQVALAIDTFNTIVAFSELHAKTATLAANLLSLASKGSLDALQKSYFRSSIAHLGTLKRPFAQELHKKLGDMF